MKQGTHINRIPVLYGVVNIPEYAEQYDIDEIVIAIPSAKPEQLKLIMEACTATNCFGRRSAHENEPQKNGPSDCLPKT